VFEIGASLREARQRLGLELAEVAQETKVRERYLRALEQERFDELPPGYRRTFLRGYAAHLGLDADAFVDEYVSRFEKPESLETARLAPPVRTGRPSRRWIWPVAATAAVTIGLVAWLAPGSGHQAHPAAPAPTPGPVLNPTAPPPAARTRARRQRTKALTVVFAATDGDCWLQIRRGGAQAPPVYERILGQGQTLNLHASRLWVRVGNPPALTLTLNGHAQQLPVRTANITIDHAGTHLAGA
jgi:transcriptional regulator with XRE-family HTH domain